MLPDSALLVTREAAPDICCLQIQESEIKTMRKMCLSPALEVALRWLAATPRAQHTAGKGPVSPATPGEGHEWVRTPGKGGRSLPAGGQGQGAAVPRSLPVSGSQGRVNSGPCHCCPPGLSAFSHLRERFRSIGPIADRSQRLLYGPQKSLQIWTGT